MARDGRIEDAKSILAILICDQLKNGRLSSSLPMRRPATVERHLAGNKDRVLKVHTWAAPSGRC